MSASEEINAKLDWCVAALRKLLELQAGVTQDEDAWLDEDLGLLEDPEGYNPAETYDFDAEYAQAAAAVVPGTPGGCPHVQTYVMGGRVTCKQCGADLGCSHNQQALVNGRLVCPGCGDILGQTGVVGRDPNAPQAGQQTHGPSSKNPGGPLVPY